MVGLYVIQWLIIGLLLDGHDIISARITITITHICGYGFEQHSNS